MRAAAPSQELGDALIGSSKIANAEGHYTAAVALAREAAEIYHKLGDAVREAGAHNNAGFACMNAADYQDAEKELNLAVNLNRNDGNPETTMSILNNLGSVRYYQAKYSESFHAYDEAMQRLEHAANAPWLPYWRKITLANLAVLYQRLGDDQRALDLYKEMQQSDAGIENRELAFVDSNLGVLYRHLGDSQKALESYRKAEQLFDSEHDSDGELGVKMDIGIVLALDLGRLDDALKAFTALRTLADAVRNRRTAMQALLYRSETLFRQDKLPEAKHGFEQSLDEARQLGTTEEQWKALYGLGRIAEKEGRPDLAETKYREAIVRIEGIRSKIQLTRLKSGFLTDKRAVYDALIRLLLARSDTAGAFEYMERSRARVFQDRFYAQEAAPAVSMRSLQERLGSSTALIEFWIGPDQIAAVWIARDSSGMALRQLTAAEMQDFGSLASHLPDAITNDWRNNLGRLSAFLPQGVQPLFSDRFTHLLIVPDGILSSVPLELISAGGNLLLERHDVTYFPTASLLTRSNPVERIHFPWQQEMIGFGNPTISSNGQDSVILPAGSAPSLELPGSADEVRQIERMSEGRTAIFLGDADRKPSLTNTHLKTAVLHISTHAVADLDNPERSRLLFSPDQPGQPNSFLFLKELYDLDLRDVNLAVLSACDTEQGQLIPGEGVQAFSRALLAAGSRSAVTTLWRVPDQPTAEFMKQFYFFLLERHKSKAEALRLAKLEFLHSGTPLSHPRYWAAFVLNGSGADLPRFLSWFVVLLPFLAVVTMGIVCWGLLWSRKSKTAL